jgi:hypothetical protein
MAMATASTWAMAMAMRLAGNKEGKGKGCKGNGVGYVRVAGNKEGNGSKVMVMATRMAGKWSTTVTKRLMATAARVAGKQRQRRQRG